jgi:hypothetical protein
VVVGIDHTMSGLAALRVAVREAVNRGVPLRAVRVQAGFARDDYYAIDAAFTAAFGGVPVSGLEVHRELASPPAAAALTNRAGKSGDLLVVGTGGHGRWHSIWYGSIGRACLRTAHCPVLIVPAPEMARTLRGSRWSTWRTWRQRDMWRRFEAEMSPPRVTGSA